MRLNSAGCYDASPFGLLQVDEMATNSASVACDMKEAIELASSKASIRYIS